MMVTRMRPRSAVCRQMPSECMTASAMFESGPRTARPSITLVARLTHAPGFGRADVVDVFSVGVAGPPVRNAHAQDSTAMAALKIALISPAFVLHASLDQWVLHGSRQRPLTQLRCRL